MHRRPLGRGRTLAAVAGVMLVIGCVLPWWKVGGGATGITPLQGNGFEGSGIIVFLVGIATLALVALPYATGDRPLAIDRWLSYLLLTIVGWIGFGIRVVALFLDGAFTFTEPTQVLTNGPGLWMTILGLALLSRATYAWPANRPTADAMTGIERLRGVWNIVPTPFAPDGGLDIASLPGLTAFVRPAGVDGMTILGVLGEAAKLADEERRQVIARRPGRGRGRCRCASA